MAVVQVAVVNEDGNPLKGVRVAAYDLDNFPAIAATGLTDETGTVQLTHTGPAFYDAFDRRGVSFRDRSYQGKIQIQVIGFNNTMNADYVVDSNGFGTHTTLFGSAGALAVAIATGSDKVIWVCTTHAETTSSLTTFVGLANNQQITVLSAAPSRPSIVRGHSGSLFTFSTASGSGAVLRFDGLNFGISSGTGSQDFMAATVGAGVPSLDLYNCGFTFTTGTSWRFLAAVGGVSTGHIYLKNVEDFDGAVLNIVGTDTTGSSNGSFWMENCDFHGLVTISNRPSSTAIDWGLGSSNQDLGIWILNNRLSVSSYLWKRTYNVPMYVIGNHIRSTAAAGTYVLEIGTAGTTSPTDATITGNYINVRTASAHGIRVTAGAGLASNIAIMANAMRGPGSGTSNAIVLDIAAESATDGYAIINSYSDWTNNVTGAGATSYSGVDHGSLLGLSDDDHSIYPLLLGRAGGQTLIGGIAASDDLIFRSTSHSTRGSIIFEDVVGDTRVVINGTEDSITVGGVTYPSRLLIHDEVAGQIEILGVHKHSDTASSGANLLFARTRGTEGAETAVVDGDVLGRIGFVGHDGTDYEQAAQIRVEIDGTPGANDMPGRLLFLTTPDASATPVERMRIVNSGGIWLTNYLRVGSLSAPMNTTNGDITAVRMQLGDDNGILNDASFYLVRNSFVPATNTYPNLQSVIMAPDGTATSSAGHVEYLRIRPTVNNSGSYYGAAFAVMHDAGAFDLTNAGSAGSLIGIQANPQQVVAGTTVAKAIGVQSVVAPQLGTITTSIGFDIYAMGISSETPLGVVGTAYSIYVHDKPAGVTVTDNIGLYIEALTGTTSAYGIYNLSNEYTAGWAKFGGTPPPLNVTGGDVSMSRLLVGDDISHATNQTTVKIRATGDTSTGDRELVRGEITLTPAATGVQGLGFYSAVRLRPTATNQTNNTGHYATGFSALAAKDGGATFGIRQLAGLTSEVSQSATGDTVWAIGGYFIHTISAGTVQAAAGIRIQDLGGAGGTITDRYAILVGNRNGTVVTRQYGLYIEAMTGATSASYGIAVGAADTATLWLSHLADSAVAAGGITFGLSKDTNLYRSAANTLKTDDSLTIGADLDHNGANIGFFGTAPAAQQASGANLTNNVTAGGVDDTIADITDLLLYVNDAATIRNDIYQLARKLKQVNDALRLYGLLT